MDQINRIRENIASIMIGMEEVTDLLLAAFFAGGHVLLEDMPGTGKTTIAMALAASTDCSFRRVQLTPDLLPSDVTGIHYYHQKKEEFVFREGPVFTHILPPESLRRSLPFQRHPQLSALRPHETHQLESDGPDRRVNGQYLRQRTGRIFHDLPGYFR